MGLFAMTNRYKQINLIIDFVKPITIVEIGTWNGDRAIEMSLTALKHNSHVHYWGFDLFELGDEQSDQEELNVKPHIPMEIVRAKLDDLQKQVPGFSADIVIGNTRSTLKNIELLTWTHPMTGMILRPSDADFVFIDGGHSVVTIDNDFRAFRSCKNILLDDYYSENAEGLCPDITKFGCNTLLGKIPHFVLPIKDAISGGGVVQLAFVGDMADSMKGTSKA